MFRVAVRRQVTVFHHLIGGDWGAENQHHSHDYIIEVVCEGAQLDRHGYLFDISVLEKHLDAAVEQYRGRSLNEQPGFEGLNPSVERFAQTLANRFGPALKGHGPTALTVVVWEHAQAWASYRVELS